MGYMKRTVLILISIVALVTAGALLFSYIQTSKEAARQNAEMRPISERPAPATVSEDAQKAGTYADYSLPAFDSTSGRRVLFFHASWCPQCRMLDADIAESSVKKGVTIFRVDYDSNQQLRQKYGVTVQTTLVEVDEDGEKVASYVAYNEPTYEAVEQHLLDR